MVVTGSLVKNVVVLDDSMRYLVNLRRKNIWLVFVCILSSRRCISLADLADVGSSLSRDIYQTALLLVDSAPYTRRS